MPWYLKLGLGAGAAFACVKATAAAVSRDHAWNSGTVKWFGIALALLLVCGLVTYYYHVYGETDDEEGGDAQGGSVSLVLPGGRGNGWRTTQNNRLPHLPCA
jgi:4-amino-4-deoxy-L-arabinose transferase-like glycosyltransferase